MKRIRLSTLMLLVVIAALVAALAVQHDRAARREAAAEARVAEMRAESLRVQQFLNAAMQQERAARVDAELARSSK